MWIPAIKKPLNDQGQFHQMISTKTIQQLIVWQESIIAFIDCEKSTHIVTAFTEDRAFR